MLYDRPSRRYWRKSAAVGDDPRGRIRCTGAAMVRWECRGPWSLRSRPRRPDHGPHDRGRPRAPASEPSPMNIGLFGNTNNGPFMLAEMLRQLGHQVVL